VSMRYFFRVQYDGTGFRGWQRQDNAPSVQQALEKAFSTVLRAPCEVVGAGRTDAGVHARRQGAHIDVAAPLDTGLVEKSVNAVLPWSVEVSGMRPVSDDFNARYSAIWRRYRYYISTVKAPLLFKRVWVLYQPVDWQLVADSIACLRGEHDFETFCSTGSSNETSRCTIEDVSLEQQGSVWVFSITADRFVYRMIRSIVGTLIGIGRGTVTESLESLLAKRDRTAAGTTAPACGLVLDDIGYQEVD
jgi:tRNA pseudouridine38-40 synthase